MSASWVRTVYAEQSEVEARTAKTKHPMARRRVTVWRLPSLQHDGDCNRFAGIPTVVKVIPVVIADINVIGGIPVLRPVIRPRVNHHERITAVLEARVTRNDHRLALDAKPMSY